MEVHNPYLKKVTKRPRSEEGRVETRLLQQSSQQSAGANQPPPDDSATTMSRNHKDSFGDSSINWDAAVELLDSVDAAAAAVAASSSSQQPQQRAAQPISRTKVAAPHPAMLPRPPTAHGRKPLQLPRPPSAAARTRPELLDRPSPWNPRKRPPSSHNNGTPTNCTGSASKRQQLQQPPPSPLQAPATTAATNMQALLPPSLQFDAQLLDPVHDDLRQSLVQHAQLSKPLANGWTLFGHQKKAVLRGLLMRRAILALDMGTGKTLTACVWARAFCKTYTNLTVIIICPVSLKDEWKRTAEQATELSVQTGTALECVGDDNQQNTYIASWGKIPDSVPGDGPFVVVADEAHSMQSMTAARTKNVLDLVNESGPTKRCVGVLLLTGTPMKNGKPLNLFALLRCCEHPLAYKRGGNQHQQVKQQRAFEEHFCAGRQQHIGRGRIVWQANGAQYLDQLRQLTSSHILYLKKEDVLKGLPPRTREFKHVPVAAKNNLQHTKALQDLECVYNNSSGNNDNKNEAILGAVQRVRMVGSFAKVDATVQLAKQILEKESAIVLFSSFVDVCKQMTQKLKDAGWGCELLTGETPAKKRQAMVDNFQNGISPVFCCTFGAGGVGLTLTAAHTVILLDRPWTPGEASQAEDRVRRIGQTKPVTCIWMSAFDLDKQIDSLIEQKKQTAAAVLGDDTENAANAGGGEPKKLSIFQMLKAVLPGAVAANKNGAGGGSISNDGMKQTSLLQFSQPSNNDNGIEGLP